MKTTENYSGHIIDLYNRRIFKGTIVVSNGTIQEIREEDTASQEYFLPGFIDAHIHIESSMLVPYEFARVAL